MNKIEKRNIIINIIMTSGEKELGTEIVKEKVPVFSVDIKKGLQEPFALGYDNAGSEQKYYVYKDDKGRSLEEIDANKIPVLDELTVDQVSYIEAEYSVNYRIPNMLERTIKSNSLITYNGEKCLSTKIFNSTHLYVPKGYTKKQLTFN